MITIVLERVDGKVLRLSNVCSVDDVRQWIRKLSIEDLLLLRRFRIVLEKDSNDESSSLVEDVEGALRDEIKYIVLDLLTKRVDIHVEHLHRVKMLYIAHDIMSTISAIDAKSLEEVKNELHEILNDDVEILRRRIDELEYDPTPIKVYIKNKIAQGEYIVYLAELQEVFLGRRLTYHESNRLKSVAVRFNKIVKNILKELEKELNGKFEQRTTSHYRNITGRFIVYRFIPSNVQQCTQ